MQTMAVRAGALLITLAASAGAWPCDYCLIVQGISPLETLNGHGLRLTQRYTLLDSLYAGADERPNPGVREEFWTTELTAFASPLPRLTVIGVLPLRVTAGDGHLHEHMPGEVEAHTDDRGGTEGVGDITLLARYGIRTRHTLTSTTAVAVSVGVKLPTGGTGARNDAGEFLDAHVQPGSGSTDVLLGVGLNHAVGRLAVSANALGRLAGEGEAGAADFEYGNSLNYDLTARYRVRPAVIGAGGRQVFAAFGIVGELRGQEDDDGLEVQASGGHTLYISPGIQCVLSRHWQIEAAWQQAVYHRLNGTQLGENYKVYGSLTYLF